MGNLQRCLIAATPTPLPTVRSERVGTLKEKAEMHRRNHVYLSVRRPSPAACAARWGGAAAPEGAAGACRNTFPRLRGRAARAVPLFSWLFWALLGGGGVSQSRVGVKTEVGRAVRWTRSDWYRLVYTGIYWV